VTTGRTVPFLTVLAFPVLLSAGIVLIPVVSDYSDHAQAARAAAQSARWFAGHLLAALAFTWSISAACQIIAALNARGGRLQPGTLPGLAAGAGLYAAGLGADGVGPLAVAAAGGAPELFFDGSGTWISGVFVAATLAFGFGLIGLVVSAGRAGVLRGGARPLALVATLVLMAAPAVPSGWALYAVALAGFGVLLPMGLGVGSH
jgi:hypothetical protein